MNNCKLGILILLLLILESTGILHAQDDPNTLTYNDVERSFYLHVPASLDESASPPLLIVLHPASSSGRAMALLTGLDAIADEQGFIVVYPNTSGYTWGADPTDPESPDDVGFIGALIDQLVETNHVDPEQVRLAGFAQGGLMAYRLACEIPERFASVAVVGVHLRDPLLDVCSATETTPVNMLILNGTANHLYRPETYTFSSPWQEETPLILGMEDTLAVWSNRNGCDATAFTEDDNTRIYTDCADGVTVAYYKILGGSANWPRNGDYTLNQFGIDASQIVTDFLAGNADWATPQPAPYTETPRTYTVYVPSTYDPATPMPVVILLHGRWGSGPNTARYTDMNRVAEANGFIGLYPDGLPPSHPSSDDDSGWNFYYGSPYGSSSEPDDAAFLSALVDDLAVDLNIDQQRVYVVGFSNGGFMVHHLACRAAEQYAAFAAVSGSGYLGMIETCQTTTPVSLLIIHGTADDDVFWDGSADYVGGQLMYTSLPILTVANFWAAHNDCGPDVETMDIPSTGLSPESQVRAFTVSDCAEDSEVVLYVIINGGHNWPGIQYEGSYDVNMDIQASDVVWEFFSRHSLPVTEDGS